jgi:hypothetical protein
MKTMKKSAEQLVPEPTFEIGTSLLERSTTHCHPQGSVVYMYLTLYVWRLMIKSKRKIEPIRERYFSQNYPAYTFTCTLKIFKKLM